MGPQTNAAKNAVGAIRVSSIKQGVEGDSPEAQREQIEQFAANRGLAISKFFVFLESASKDQQPMQEAIDYCKDPRNGVDCFIIKSIDRFTRGGSLSYDLLKSQLEAAKVKLVDIYGIISSSEINTLEHLGVEYKWSVYSPSKKSEILEAERSKDELRDIMTRVIGAEVRYTRLGYWMRMPPYGYASQRVDTPNGKRTILVPHPEESKFVRAMFELRATGQYTDEEIVKKINAMGYLARSASNRYKRKPGADHRSRVHLTTGHLWRFIRRPIYAGVNAEKWTNGKPVRCAFEGLISIDLFNRANKGRRVIGEADGLITVEDIDEPRYKDKGKRDNDFPYKRFVTCPECRKPLLGSSSTGRSGKKYPAYHCSKRGHSFRISKAELEQTVDDFIGRLKLSPERVDQLFAAFESAWEEAKGQHQTNLGDIDAQILNLENEVTNTVQKLKLLTNETAIKYMEEDLAKQEQAIARLKAEKQELAEQKPRDLKAICRKVKHMVEHLDELVRYRRDPVKKAKLFGLLFDKLPSYADLAGGTGSTAVFAGVNELFRMKKEDLYHLEGHLGLEPRTHGLRVRCSNQLS